MVLKQNNSASQFSLLQSNTTTVSLKDYKGSWVIVYFYPKDNTPGCTIEATEFSSHQKEFAKLGAHILGVSPDSCASHQKFVAKKDLTITLLSDPKHIVAEKYGVWGEKKFMGRSYKGIIRSTFLINPEGKIVRVWKNVKVKGHVTEVLEALKEQI